MSNEINEELDKLNINTHKQVINIIFVGHVDAGKSTICGQILVLENIVDTRTIEKYREAAKDSGVEGWYLSWCLDTNPEERDKGKTTELGIATITLGDRRINILDSPGHKQYIFEMINGANLADVGILVVSARINEFEAGFEKGGQTREHILLMKSSSVQKIIVLVNKMDDPSVNWDKTRYEEIKKKIGLYTKNLFKDTLYIPVSGMKGTNIKNKCTTSWYTGPTFYEHLSSIHVDRKDTSTNIVITEKSKSGSILVGRIESGTVSKDTVLKLVPRNTTVQVTCIYNLDDVEVNEGVVGDNLRFKLNKNIDEVNIGNRLVECDNSDYKMSNMFTCKATILECDTVICSGFTCMLHVGMMSTQCKVKEVRDMDNKKLRYIKAGSRVLLKIETEKELLLTDNENRKEKFSLRLGEKTLGVGVVRKVLLV